MITPAYIASGLLLLNGALAQNGALPMDPSTLAGSADGSFSADGSISFGGQGTVASADGAGAAPADGTTAPPTTSFQGQDGNMVTVQVVKVSNKDAALKFDPEEITAEPGSAVQFHFYPKAHTLTQSTFDKPCEPISLSMPNVTGIDSGPLPPENGMMKVFTIMVNETSPLWFYCATGNHCQQGMSMVINPPDSQEKTLAAYKTASAEASTSNSTGSYTINSIDSPEGSDSNDGDSVNSEASQNGDSASSASSILKPIVGTTTVAAVLVAAFAFWL